MVPRLHRDADFPHIVRWPPQLRRHVLEPNSPAKLPWIFVGTNIPATRLRIEIFEEGIEAERRHHVVQDIDPAETEPSGRLW